MTLVSRFQRDNLSPHDFHYNGAITAFAGKLWCVYRAHNANGVEDFEFWEGAKRSQLWVAELGTDLQPVASRRIDLPFVDCEDPSVVVGDGRVYVFFTRHDGFVTPPTYDPMVAVCDSEWRVLECHKITLEGRLRVEKNWQFFYDNGWKCVYTMQPWQVAEFDENWRGRIVHKAYAKLPWQFGELRGGASPVRADGSMWSWFHSAYYPAGDPGHDYRKGVRVYVGGLLRFRATPPYDPLGISTVPAMWPDLLDAGWVKHARVVFPRGALFNESDRHWLVSYGYNDKELRVAKFRHDDLLKVPLWREVKGAGYSVGKVF